MIKKTIKKIKYYKQSNKKINFYEKIFILIKQNKMFSWIVLFPVLIVLFYSLVLQSSRYESSAVISIQKNQQGLSSIGIGSLLGGITGNDGAVQSQVVIDYINSLNMYNQLDSQINISNMLKNHHIDIISRLKSHPDQKELIKYYDSKLSAFYNSQSQTIELKFQGFTPQDSQLILKQIILNVQNFVNNLDQQLVTQKINFGKKQVLNAHQKLVDAEAKIIAFQNNRDMFDPKTETGIIMGILASLQSQLVMNQANLADKGAYYQADSIEIQSIQQKIDTIKSQINMQKQRLLGISGVNTNDLKLNQAMAQFEELSMQAKVAVAEYAASIQGLEMSRAETIQQKQQVVIVQTPVLPDYAEYPQVWYNALLMLILLTMTYGVIKMFMRIISEHNL